MEFVAWIRRLWESMSKIMANDSKVGRLMMRGGETLMSVYLEPGEWQLLKVLADRLEFGPL